MEHREIYRCSKMPIILLLVYLASIVLRNVHGDLEHEIPRRSILSRRAIDGSRGRKYFDPEEEGSFDSYGSAGGQYDRYKEKQDHSDIRMNVPGEPGIDYPAYTTLPQTSFSCEGRSRGYYADEVAGCQVFHVCHDILVSSFLCPIGSIFSQKLLTCDWWSKVDCSMTRKFIEINRDYNQEDDDELIRKAYGMMGLHPGIGVTSDELVDPDRGGRIIDRITIQSTGNDLTSYRDHLPRFLPDYNEQSEKSSTSYQNSFYSKSYHTRPRPYQDSPIVNIRKIGEEGYQDVTGHRYSQEKSGKMINEFQPSYAPTVPTVTTTTRRFYSPTIPITATTTYRPFTLAYNKFDQDIESSDHLYTRSEQAESFFTASTDPDREFESSISIKRKYNDSNLHGDRIDNDELRNNYGVQVKNIDLLNDQYKSSFDTFSGYDTRNSSDASMSVRERYSDDIETKESIGLAQAVNGSNKFRIHVQDNSFLKETTNIVYNLTKSLENIGKSDNLAHKTETTIPLNYNTRVHVLKDVLFAESTTPSIEYSPSPSNVDDHRIKIEDNSSTTVPYEENSSSENILTESTEENRWISTTKVSRSLDNVENSYSTQEPRIFSNNHPYDIYTTPLQPDIVLKPPIVSEFRINVPDYPSTNRVPTSSGHYITYGEGIEGNTRLPGDEGLSEGRNPSNLAPAFEKNTQSSTLEKLIDLSHKNSNNFDSTQRTSENYEKVKFVVSSNNSSSDIENYPVTSNVQDDAVTTISPLISQEERVEKNLNPSKSHPIEIVRSIEKVNYETSIASSLQPPSFVPTNNTVSNTKSLLTDQQDHSYRKNDTAFPLHETGNFLSNRNKGESNIPDSSNANALSLLQLMAELFKIDHIPRPFALNNFQNVKSRATDEYEHWINNNNDNKETREINKSIQTPTDTTNEEEIFPTPRDRLDVTITPRNYLKDQQRTELEFGPRTESKRTEELDRPLLYDIENQRSIYQLPHLHRSINFKESKEFEELPIISTKNLTASTERLSTPVTTTTTTESVKTTVETEFVPSIGFSFDTNEGRQEYIDAVLSGLLYEPIHRESGSKNESINLETTENSSNNGSLTQL